METQSILVIPAGEEMEYKVYASSQWPALVQVCSFLNVSFTEKFSERIMKYVYLWLSRYQSAVAETLNIPSNRVSCHVKRIGGAFGGKITKTSILACITSVAACKCVSASDHSSNLEKEDRKNPVCFFSEPDVRCAVSWSEARTC